MLITHEDKKYLFSNAIGYATIAVFENDKMIDAVINQSLFQAKTNEEAKIQLQSFLTQEKRYSAGYISPENKDKWRDLAVGVNIFAKQMETNYIAMVH